VQKAAGSSLTSDLIMLAQDLNPFGVKSLGDQHRKSGESVNSFVEVTGAELALPTGLSVSHPIA
jgi:hypothetical protein